MQDQRARKSGKGFLPLAVGKVNPVYRHPCVGKVYLVAFGGHDTLDQVAVPAGTNAVRNEAACAPIARHHVLFGAEQNEIAFMNWTVCFEINAKRKATCGIHHEKTTCYPQEDQHKAEREETTLQKRRGPGCSSSKMPSQVLGTCSKLTSCSCTGSMIRSVSAGGSTPVRAFKMGSRK